MKKIAILMSMVLAVCFVSSFAFADEEQLDDQNQSFEQQAVKKDLKAFYDQDENDMNDKELSEEVTAQSEEVEKEPVEEAVR